MRKKKRKTTMLKTTGCCPLLRHILPGNNIRPESEINNTNSNNNIYYNKNFRSYQEALCYKRMLILFLPMLQGVSIFFQSKKRLAFIEYTFFNNDILVWSFKNQKFNVT